MKENKQVEPERNAVSVPPEDDSRLTVARQAAPPDALTDFGKVEIGIERATAIANKLADVIKKRDLAVPMGKKEHLMVEAWLACGFMVGVSPKTEWTQEVRHPTTGDLEGYKSRVQAIRMATGAVIGAAESACHFDERVKRSSDGELIERWIEHGRPNRHACLSMSQTRATSKALAQALRWIPVLAGYSGTPYEEMNRDEKGDGKGNDKPRGKSASGSSGGQRTHTNVSEAMAKRAIAIARSRGQEIKPPVHGFEVIADMLNLGSMEVQPDGSRYPDLIAHLVKVLPPKRYDGFCDAIPLYEGPDKPLAKPAGAEAKPAEAESQEPPAEQPPTEEMVPVADGNGGTKMIPIRQAVEHVDEQSGEIFYTEVPF